MALAGVIIDGKQIRVNTGYTILEGCRQAGIHIPTLCHHEQLNPIGSCQICTVELQDYGLVLSCANLMADGMVISTKNDRVISFRKERLESLLSEHYGDCIPPCQDACPAGVDIPGFIALIARGAYSEAVELIKETLILPATIGRICPHPCEDACRRNLIDKPVAVCSLKRFVADRVLLEKVCFAPAIKPESGKKVAIVGSGPAGLSAACHLYGEGHEVTIYESLPEAGGMLRYGIPDYRLPKEILRSEIATITGLGVKIKTDRVLGRDYTIKTLFDEGFHSVFLALGAHLSQKMNIEGEEMKGVLSGIDFLRSVAMGKSVETGKRVVVVGGGNTAIDAARTALRIGAEEVSILYRRSRTEMPATEWEIEEAEEEGVKLHLLVAPVKVTGDNYKVSSIMCVRMKLGKPDKSGRRRPEPVKGSEFDMAVDSVIMAIGQRPDLDFMDNEKGINTEWGNILTDPRTLLTNMKGVFAGGDCVTGAATAVEAIAAGREAAVCIDRYLKGEEPAGLRRPFSVIKGQLNELVGDEEFIKIESKPRQIMPKLIPGEKQDNFKEIASGFPENMAKKEAERCLECGCKAVDSCSFRKLSYEYQVEPVTGRKDRVNHSTDKSHPFITRDPNKCIGCMRCTRLCLEIQGVGAFPVSGRTDTNVMFGRSWQDSTCISCGLCIDNCPVGAIVAKNNLRPATEVKTICSYCGVGCGIYLGVRGSTVVGIRGDENSQVNKGNLCVKGRFGYDYINHSDRLTSPLIKKNGKFVDSTWDEALDLIAAKFTAYKGAQFAAISSAKCTNEENYIIQKFVRSAMGTNNIDHCARLCHAPSVAGLTETFGSGAMTNSINEIGDAACIFAIGSNTTESHPVIGLQIKRAKQKRAGLIVANPRRIDLCRFADIWLRQRPGTDVALLMGMARVIVDEGLLDLSFIEKHCDNFTAFKESLKNFDIDSVEKITEVAGDKIIAAARLYASDKPATILYAMGITQHSHGTDNVLAISNLAMLTGNIGKPSSGVNPLRGQNNVQGACDMGSLPNVYNGYQNVADSMVRQRFEEAWECNLSGTEGLTLTEIFKAAHQEHIKTLYIIGENPVLSEPDSGQVRLALDKLDFLVVQDIFLTETAQLADVILPAATFAEKDGTFTNTERRVQRVRKAIEPIGDSRADWWIVCEIARRMGAGGFQFDNPSEIFEEITCLTPIYKGLSYRRLDDEGIQWPCTDPEHPGTPILHKGRFATANGKGRLMPLEYKPPAETINDEYPLILTTERCLYHYHTGTMTKKVKGLNILRERELVEMNSQDASNLEVSDGETVRVISRRGEVTAAVKITESSPPGVVSMTFHFAESPTNVLTSAHLDPVSGIPELKVCAIRIEKNKI